MEEKACISLTSSRFSAKTALLPVYTVNNSSPTFHPASDSSNPLKLFFKLFLNKLNDFPLKVVICGFVVCLFFLLYGVRIMVYATQTFPCLSGRGVISLHFCKSTAGVQEWDHPRLIWGGKTPALWWTVIDIAWVCASDCFKICFSLLSEFSGPRFLIWKLSRVCSLAQMTTPKRTKGALSGKTLACSGTLKVEDLRSQYNFKKKKKKELKTKI